ncbi:hypothetical protein XELAEV_18041416mg [Xenopus laevis]|uniref:Uncharacterized protein n=1 Tax=Xenopus laevis TaxID=8355 RepID=A0A974H535_XENLA|nr:hypothetical protein XELAEV_18041416mg [Xenopus laevis]
MIVFGGKKSALGSPHVTDCSLEQVLPPPSWGKFQLSNLHNLDTNPLACVALGNICLQPKRGIKSHAITDGARGHVWVNEGLNPILPKYVIKHPANGARDAVGAVLPQPLQTAFTERMEAHGQNPGLHWPIGSVIIQTHGTAQNISQCFTLSLL